MFDEVCDSIMNEDIHKRECCEPLPIGLIGEGRIRTFAQVSRSSVNLNRCS